MKTLHTFLHAYQAKLIEEEAFGAARTFGFVWEPSASLVEEEINNTSELRKDIDLQKYV